MKKMKCCKKMISMLLLSSLIISCLSGCQNASAKKELNLFTWAGMFPQEILDGFEEETGIKINYSNFEYDEEMLAKLEETNGGDYDLVIADDYIIDLVIKENLAQKLDKKIVNNTSNINPIYENFFYDLSSEYTVPVGAGIPLIVYDKEKTGFEITSYEDLWNPALKDNVLLLGNYRVINGIVLKTMGQSFNTNNVDVLTQAGEKLNELAPNVRMISDSGAENYVINGEVAAAFMYTSQVNAALSARPDLSVAYPKEGLGFGIMAAFVPSKAPNSEAANKFLEYILRPEIGAACIEYLGYYCTNKAAEEFISEDMKSMLILPDDIAKGEIIENVEEETEETHNRIWENFQSQLQ